MSKLKKQEIPNVKPVTFESYLISADGEQVIFEVKDRAGNKGHIALDWLKLSQTVQLIGRGAEEAASIRQKLGKADYLTDASGLSFQIVAGFQVSDYPALNAKLLSLQSPTGFRADFAIPTDNTDQLGRALPRALAEELLRDAPSEKQRLN